MNNSTKKKDVIIKLTPSDVESFLDSINGILDLLRTLDSKTMYKVHFDNDPELYIMRSLDEIEELKDLVKRLYFLLAKRQIKT